MGKGGFLFVAMPSGCSSCSPIPSKFISSIYHVHRGVHHLRHKIIRRMLAPSSPPYFIAFQQHKQGGDFGLERCSISDTALRSPSPRFRYNSLHVVKGQSQDRDYHVTPTRPSALANYSNSTIRGILPMQMYQHGQSRFLEFLVCNPIGFHW